jgi:hypothetical protein
MAGHLCMMARTAEVAEVLLKAGANSSMLALKIGLDTSALGSELGREQV